MKPITIQNYNSSHLRVFGDVSIEHDLKDYFTFRAANYRFHPKYKAGLWDGNISMYNVGTKKIPAGLLGEVIKFFEKEEIEFVLDGFDDQEELISREGLSEFIESLNITIDGNKIQLREHQFECILASINARRLVSEVPTSGGKSLIIYCIARYLLSHGLRFMLVVPSIMLVNQMYSDFADYSSMSDWDVTENCNKLHSGEAKEFTKPLLISTWQTLSSMARKSNISQILNTYDGVCIDECHQAKSTELVKLLEQMVDVSFRFGTTGTVHPDLASKLTIEGHLGPVFRAITTKELMEKGEVSDLQIHAIVLKYSDADRELVAKHNVEYTHDGKKKFRRMEYQQEMDFINSHTRRQATLSNIAMACKGTTLLLVQKVEEHAVPIYNDLVKKSERPVYMIHGKVKEKERERIKKLVSEQDCILVATYQTLSTGVSINNIANVIFGSPSKSLIRVLQSIGRGLRLHKLKNRMNLIDVVDDIKYKKTQNYALDHFEERLKIYQTQKFAIKIKEFQF